jgi:photosystem II stability/assembly factor-like uncharacterized protein
MRDLRQRRHGGRRHLSRLATAAACAARIGLVAAFALAPGAAGAATSSWQSIGPSGGVALSVAVDPADPATAYAASGAAGLFKTVDAGLSWSHSDAGLRPGLLRRVVVDPGTPATVYVVAGPLFFGTDGTEGAGGGLFKSTDGGVTWAPAVSGLGGTSAFSLPEFLSDLAIDPQTPATLYAAVGSRVFKSVDGAASWMDSGAGLRPEATVNTVVVDPVQPATLYAGTSIGVWKSLDAGASWLPARQGMAQAPIVALAVDPRAHGTVYAGAQPFVFGRLHGLFVSADGGATWTARPVAAGNPAVVCLAVSPAADRAVFACAAGKGVVRSLDAGLHWQAVNQGLPAADFAALAIAPSLPSRLFAGVGATANGGSAVYRSPNEATFWRPFGNGIDAVNVTALAVDPRRAGRVYLGTGDLSGPGVSGVLRTLDDGATWATADNGLGAMLSVSALAIDPLAPATLYVETDGGLFASHNGASLWSRPGAPFQGGPPLVVDPQTPATLYSSGPAGLYKSRDGGATWSLILAEPYPTASLFALAPSAPSTLYVAEFIPSYHPGYSLYASQNGGATFQGVFDDEPTDLPILAVDPTQPQTLYFELVSTSYILPGLFKSTDGGHTGTLLLSGEEPAFSLAIDPANPAVLYAGTANDVIVSRDGGATWAELAPGLPPLPVNQLAFGPAGTLYAALQGNGVYRLAL